MRQIWRTFIERNTRSGKCDGQHHARETLPLTKTNICQTHPLHLAHLNFYTALSHDTLAREATLKNRWKELNLAEVHYSAAILALASLQSPTQCDPWSPNSSTSGLPSPYSRRRADSIDSDRSSASSATSLGEDGDDNDNDDEYYVQLSTKESTSEPQPSLSTPTARPQTPQQYYFSSNIAAFVRMLEAHLADVRLQRHRTSVPSVRFTMPSPRPSPTKASAARHGRFASLGGEVADADEVAMDLVRERRRNVRFRPRFDPKSVRRLCGEALAELAE